MTAPADEDRGWRGQTRARPRHVVLAAVVAGLLLGPAAPPAVIGAFALALALALRAARLATPAAALLSAAAVVGAAALAQDRVAHLERTELALGPVRGTATLTAAAKPGAYGGWRAPAEWQGEPVVLRWGSWLAPEPEPSALRVGEHLSVTGELVTPDLGTEAVGAHATVRVQTATPTGTRRGGLHGAVDRLRDRALDVLERGPPPADGALLQGMVLGQDAGLPIDVRDDLRAAGLAHLVAASGQNVLLLAALAAGLGAIVGLPIRPRRTMIVLLIGLYVLLAGAGPSIQRAGVMGAASIIALTAGRATARWYALLLAAAVTVTLDPRAVGDPGWQMSFAAVLSLVLLAPRLRAWAASRGLPRGVAEAIAIAACATLATAPIASAHFGRTSIVAVPANLAAAPAVAPATWLGMAGAAVGQVSETAAAPLVGIAATPTAYIRWVGQTAARLPGAEREIPALVVLASSVLLLVVVATLRPRRDPLGALASDGGDPDPDLRPRQADRRTSRTSGQSRRSRRSTSREHRQGHGPGRERRRARSALIAALLGLGALAALGPARAAGPPDPRLRLAFLDVGQGDATLVQAGGASVLVDAGPPDGRVLDRLDEQGVDRLDAILISHDALDHHGGLQNVRRRFPATPVLLPGVATAALRGRLGDQAVSTVTAGQAIRHGTLTLRVLWPDDETPETGEPNDSALVLEATDGRRRALLPADAESPVLRRLELGDVDVLKVSHHGSADDGLPATLEATTPEFAVISAGARNRYGHPAPETLGALREAGIPTRRTDRDGTVVVIP